MNPNSESPNDSPDNDLSDSASEPKPGKKNRHPGEKQRSFAGNLLWTFGRSVGVAIIQFVVLVVLSRVLQKAELGWATTIMSITYLAQLLAWMGIAPAMIQRPDLTDEHISTGIIVSFASGVLQTVLGAAFAGPIAALYKMPEVEPYLRVSALVFFLMGVSRVTGAVIEREMRFDKTAKVELISGYAYGLATIILALTGFGLWSVVIGLLVQAIVKSYVLFKGERIPRPFRFSMTAYRDLMSVARGFSAATILSYLASNIDNLIVGRWMGPAALGTYSRAFQLMARPSQMLAKSLNLVLYPTMARKQEDRADLQAIFEKTTTSLAVLVMPIGFVACVLGPEIVYVLLGNRWPEVIVPFQIMAAGMFFRVGNLPSDSMTQAIGATKGRVLPKMYYTVAVAVFVYLGVRVGSVEAVSWGIVAANAIHTFSMGQVCVKHLGMGWGGFFRAHQAPALVTVVASAGALLVAVPLRHAHASHALTLFAGLLVAAAATFALLKFGGQRLLGDSMVLVQESFGRMLKRRSKRAAAAA